MGKKREEMSGKQTNLSIKNPSVAGNSTRDNGSYARRKKERIFFLNYLFAFWFVSGTLLKYSADQN